MSSCRFGAGVRLCALATLFLLTSCSNGVVTPGDEGPASLEFVVPASAVTGRAFEISVSALDAGGRRVEDFTGSVTLSASPGSVSPTSLSLLSGTVTESVTLTGASGAVVLTASFDQLSAIATIDTVLIGSLVGAGSDPAGPAVPSQLYLPETSGFATDHPLLPGVSIAFNQVLVALESSATIAQVNAVLDAVGGVVVGGLPTPAGVGAVLVIKLPASSHAEAAPLLAALESATGFAVVSQDIALETTLVTTANGGTPADWTWGVTPGGDNWGLEAIRMPQAWNWANAIRKAGDPAIPTTVLDVGFAAAHPDIVWVANTSAVAQEHGTHVAGTVGATVGNGIGVDGVNPFARISANRPPYGPAPADTFQNRLTLGQAIVTGLAQAIASGARVVNTSLAYNWNAFGIDANATPAAQDVANAQGLLLQAVVDGFAAGGTPVPLIVTAAGNDSQLATPLLANWASPMANASIVLGTPEVIVVEAVGLAAAPDGLTRGAFSNTGGTVSAPGVGIWSLGLASGYVSKNGTSMAAPHVTGLVGYLLALAPDLTNQELRDILLRNTMVTAGGATNAVDAWASVLNIDWARGDLAVLKALLDIDDGSIDGNQRRDKGGAPTPGEDVDGDGGEGDGTIDMSDFRRWRDALAYVEDPGAVLDGAADHPKKDLNRDSTVGVGAAENVYPRADFNGDGILDRAATSWVPGMVDAALTDLQVLQQLFDDPDVLATELDDLIESGDVLVDATDAFAAHANAVSAVVEVRVVGSPDIVVEREHLPNDASAVRVYTLPVDQYTITITMLDDSANELGTEETEVIVLIGSDDHWTPTAPASEPVLFAYASFDVGVTDLYWGAEETLTVTALQYDTLLGDYAPLDGGTVSVVTTNGSAGPAIGFTDFLGEFETVVVANAGADTVTIDVLVEGAAGQSYGVLVKMPAKVPDGRNLVLARRWDYATAVAGGQYGGVEDSEAIVRDSIAFGPWEATATASGYWGGASATIFTDVVVDSTGLLTGIVGIGSGTTGFGIEGDADMHIWFQVRETAATVSLSAVSLAEGDFLHLMRTQGPTSYGPVLWEGAEGAAELVLVPGFYILQGHGSSFSVDLRVVDPPPP